MFHKFSSAMLSFMILLCHFNCVLADDYEQDTDVNAAELSEDGLLESVSEGNSQNVADGISSVYTAEEQFTPILKNEKSVLAEDEKKSFNNTQQTLESRSSEGEAYAVLTEEGELIFFRSNNTYTNDDTGIFEDLYGSSYTGTLFRCEENDLGYMSWRDAADKITSIRVADGQSINPKTLKQWFFGLYNLKTADMRGFDTSKVNNMSEMFDGCYCLSHLDLSSFDTSNTTDISFMFAGCSGLISLDLSGFNTSKITDMSYMFANCTSLKNLDVSNFDTGNVIDMQLMFYSCNSLTGLNVSYFNTSEVTNMMEMFGYCSSLSWLDLSSFDTSNTTDMSYMFYNCNNLPSLDLSSFDTSKVTNMVNMFSMDDKISTIFVSEKWNVDRVTRSNGMFINCSNLPNYNSEVVDKTKAHYRTGGYLTYKPSGNNLSNFEIGIDNNSFDHSDKSFLWSGEENYCISDSLYSILKNRANAVQRMKLYLKRNWVKWDGSCEGLNAIMAMISEGYHDFFLDKSKTFYNITSPLNVPMLRDTINYYQLLFNFLVKSDYTVAHNDDIHGFLQKLVTDAQKGKPFIFSYPDLFIKLV